MFAERILDEMLEIFPLQAIVDAPSKGTATHHRRTRIQGEAKHVLQQKVQLEVGSKLYSTVQYVYVLVHRLFLSKYESTFENRIPSKIVRSYVRKYESTSVFSYIQ